MDWVQKSLFDGEKQYKVDKPIRLIELFAGIGAQAKALQNIGADFEHYRICEFDKYAVQSYNAVHGTQFETSDITKINASDLGITDTDKYEYIMTYSFPCTDLSKAGQQKGMAKGSGTRSGLLWEVERLLDECEELPQVLLMENVPDVIGTKNISHFANWIKKLETLGYHNYWKLLNAKDYGIPQNRNRCFMVSLLGDYYYDFPQGFPLELRLKDMLETEVDEKYYLSETGVKFFEDRKDKMNVRKNGDAKTTILEPPHGYSNGQEYDTDIFPTLTTGTSQQWKTVLKEPQLDGFESSGWIYSKNGLCPTINTMGGGNREPKVLEPRILTPKRTEYGKAIRKDYEAGLHKESRHNFTQLEPKQEPTSNTITTVQKDNMLIEPRIFDIYNHNEIKNGICGILTSNGNTSSTHCGTFGVMENNYRIRKLTPKECWRLMGFDDSDFDKAKASGVSNSQLYKQAGNSIVVNVLEAIFKQIL